MPDQHKRSEEHHAIMRRALMTGQCWTIPEAICFISILRVKSKDINGQVAGGRLRPLMYISFDLFKKLGFAFWDIDRMSAYGLLPDPLLREQ